MATLQELPEIISRHEVTAFRNAPEPDGEFVRLKEGDDLENLFDISIRAGKNEIPLEEFKMDWYSRYRRMVKDLGHTQQDVADIIGQTKQSVKNFASDLPRQMRYAVVLWEKVDKERDV